MTKIAIVGASGRMGRVLAQAISVDNGATLTAAVDRLDGDAVGCDMGQIAGIGYNNVIVGTSLLDVIDNVDVVIDFSSPLATAQHADLCSRHGKNLVIGTTGLTSEQIQCITAASEYSSICMSSNFAMGVNLCFKLAEIAASALGDDVDIEISEAHHKHKLDAPSGTALTLGGVVARALDRDLDKVAVYQRQGEVGVRDSKAIGFSSVRAGDIVGDHTVMFSGHGERIEITHRASNRMAFAKGAVRAAKWLSGQDSGLFDMQDVLELK